MHGGIGGRSLEEGKVIADGGHITGSKCGGRLLKPSVDTIMNANTCRGLFLIRKVWQGLANTNTVSLSLAVFHLTVPPL